jgi:hypothetical protein
VRDDAPGLPLDDRDDESGPFFEPTKVKSSSTSSVSGSGAASPGRRWQPRVGGVDPVSDRLEVDREEAADAALAVAFEVELEGGFPHLLVVAERVGRRRVLAAA